MAATALPIVLVSADVRSIDGFDWQAVFGTYIAALAQSSRVIPLMVPSLGPSILTDNLLERVHGVVVTGSRSNVHPSHYGVAPAQEYEPYDTARDSTSLPLIREGLARGLPLLAICRGHQELNVALGGSLHTEIQTLEGRADHRGGPSGSPAPQRFGLNHSVILTPGGVLEGLLGASSIMVNSVHRQAIDRIADGLAVEAVAEDGTIEAVSVKGAKCLAIGLQWHPEYWVAQGPDKDAPSTRLFEAFGEAAFARMQENDAL